LSIQTAPAAVVVLLFLCPAYTFAFDFAFELLVRADRRLQLMPLKLEVTAALVRVLALVLALVQALLPASAQVRVRHLASIVLHLQLHDFDFSDPFLYSS
jgi:hypothetical protein